MNEAWSSCSYYQGTFIQEVTLTRTRTKHLGDKKSVKPTDEGSFTGVEVHAALCKSAKEEGGVGIPHRQMRHALVLERWVPSFGSQRDSLESFRFSDNTHCRSIMEGAWQSPSLTLVPTGTIKNRYLCLIGDTDGGAENSSGSLLGPI